MTPQIDRMSFGSITIDGTRYDHDVIVRLGGVVEKRRKKLSKAVTGTSHRVSREEIEDLLEEGVEGIVIGRGQSGVLAVSDEALEYLEARGCDVIARSTPDAIEIWNAREDNVVGLFHVTC